MSIQAASVGGSDSSQRGRSRWRNWAGNQRAYPTRVHRPRSEAEIAGIVREAALRGERVKAIGSGHSFTGIAVAEGHLIDLSRYRRVLDVDRQSGLVTVQAGIKLSELSWRLFDEGLSMEDMGDVAYQTIAGALATGTHGTGARYGCIATQVRGLRLVDGEGNAIECSPTSHAEIFRSARVGLGALGIVSAVTLQCEPAFNLHALEQPMPIDEVLRDLDTHIEANEHFEFFWQPGAAYAFTKRNNRTPREAEPLGRWRRFRDDRIIGDWAANGLVQLGRRFPSASRRLRRRLPPTGREDYVDRSYRVFTSERRVKFHEMEYFIPREAAREVFERYRSFLARTGLEVSMAIEMRFTAADDIPLSMAYGRETCSFAVHLRTHERYQQYFEGVEAIMSDLDGRPHWGKLHFQTHETLRARYPRWDEFQAVRRELDPNGRFANDYLDRVLGSIEPTPPST
ncbi:MAG: D-arabinono-1,4-lactone oxidase [Dehalococcoidia bacterium]